MENTVTVNFLYNNKNKTKQKKKKLMFSLKVVNLKTGGRIQS